MKCRRCDSENTYIIESHTGNQKTTGVKITVEIMGCQNCGNRWVY